MKFSMKYDWRARLTTIFFVLLVVAVLSYAFYFSGGSYFPAWITVLVISVALLSTLSVPRYVLLTPFSIEVHCLVEVTRIEYKDIKSVCPLSRRDMRFLIPIFGIPGIFGYYGYFFNFRRMKIIKVYTRKWDDFVLIENSSGQQTIVGVPERETFLAELKNLS